MGTTAILTPLLCLLLIFGLVTKADKGKYLDLGSTKIIFSNGIALLDSMPSLTLFFAFLVVSVYTTPFFNSVDFEKKRDSKHGKLMIFLHGKNATIF